MSNKCPICGSSGYQGLFDFQCDNQACELCPKKGVQGTTFKKEDAADNAHHILITASQPQPSPPNPPLFSLKQKFATPWTSIYLTFLKDFVSTQNYGEIPIIAGGMALNNYHNTWNLTSSPMSANDCDIFTCKTNIQKFEKDMNVSLTLKSTLGPPVGNNRKYPSCFEVWDFQYNGANFQLINCNVMPEVPGCHRSSIIESHIAGFDFGINMIGISHDGLLLISDEFEEDMNNAKLTIYPKRLTQQQFHALPERFAKMSKKTGFTKLCIST